MPARLVQVTIMNSTDYPIIWRDDGRPAGFWQEPWYPSNMKYLKPGEHATFRQESGGVGTGVEGWALFKVEVPFAANVGDRSQFLRLWWIRPYMADPFDGQAGAFDKRAEMLGGLIDQRLCWVNSLRTTNTICKFFFGMIISFDKTSYTISIFTIPFSPSFFLVIKATNLIGSSCIKVLQSILYQTVWDQDFSSSIKGEVSKRFPDISRFIIEARSNLNPSTRISSIQ